MSVTSFIALRYLKANRENRFFSWIALLSIAGIAIGVAAMIVVLSVINGFETELRNRFLSANAHILAYRFPAGLTKYEKWEALVREKFGDDVTGVAPFIYSDTLGRKDYIIHAVLVRGIDPQLRKNVQDIKNIIRPESALQILQDEVNASREGKGLPAEPAIILGVGLASVMQAQIGDTVELVSPKTAEDNPLGEMLKFKVVGIYDSGLQHYDNKLAVLSIPAAQNLFNMGELVTGLEIGLKDPNESKVIAEKMSGQFNISIKEWQSYNRNIFEAMRNEKTVIGFIVALVAFVASFNILTTLFISVTQKQRDISILRALGANSRQILTLFIKQSMLIGLLGGVFGVIFAFALANLLERVPFIKLPDIYLLATLPVSYDWKVYLGVMLAGIFIAGLAGLYPSWSATRVTPTEGLADGLRK